MPLISTPYYDITCSGRIDNIRQPNCPAVSKGGFNSEEVVKQALERGWTEKGSTNYLCPGCSYIAPDVPVVQARKPRQKSNPPVAMPEQWDGQTQ